MRNTTALRAIAILALASSAFAIAQVRPAADAASAPPVAATDLSADGQQRVARDFANLPVSFVENRGQTDERVSYYAEGNDYGFFLTPSAIVMSLARKSASTHESGTVDKVALALQFVGSDPDVQPRGLNRASGVINDLRGSDPNRWRTGIPQYGDVVYRNLWPDIDLKVREQAGVLKYEFHVHRGASPADIRLAYDGADGLDVDAAGRLQVATALGVLQDSAPVSYQEVDGARVPVASRYVVGAHSNGSTAFAFDVGAYQPDRELVIDPGVQYTTFLGGNSHEIGTGIAVNSAGNAFVAGTTQSPDFPTTTGAFDRTGATSNFSDVFVTKLNAAGSGLLYSTFVGGSNLEDARRLAVDVAGNAYVTGTTKSSNFPTTGGAFDRTINIPPNCPRCATDVTDGFVFKLNAAGSGLSYSTYLGGVEYDSPRGIAVDGSGNAYVTGETLSSDYPTTAGAFSRTLRGEYDMFATKLNATGTALTYSTLLGGTAVDNGERISVDPGGNAYLLGFSSSTDFPTTAGAFDTTTNGGFDTTLTKLNAAGSALVYSTYLGGSDGDGASGLTVDGAGSAYVTGGTPSANFPTTAGAYDRTLADSDGYVTKFNPAGSALVYSTFIGGSSSDSITSIVLDAAGNAWLTGGGSSADFPVTPGAPDTTFNGAGDAVIAELNSAGSGLLFGTFLGGSQGDSGNDIARDAAGDIYITGMTFSQDFPATVGAFDRLWNGDLTIFWGDAFVSKLDIHATSSTPTEPPGIPPAPTLLSPPNGSSEPQPITFDWSDVTSAVSYTIQIDDTSSFTAPLVREQSVTSSVAAATGLASATHFWRVRGVNSAGAVGAWSAVGSFTPQAAPPPAALSNVDVNPSSVAGGDASSGTIVMSSGPAADAVVSLSSSNPSVASVPATVTVPANSFTGSFTIATSPVTSTASVTITATYNGATRSAPLTVTAGAVGVTLQSVTISPSTVSAGSNTSGFVSMSGAAPAGGAVVALSSSDAAVASVPASVTVTEGTTASGFTVTTSAVSTTTSVTISATYQGVTRTAVATVTPAAAATPPPVSLGVTVTVTATGRSGERVVSSPAGVNVTVGSSGSASFASGASIVLTPSNGRDAIFSGACSSGGSKVKSCTFAPSSNVTVAVSVQ